MAATKQKKDNKKLNKRAKVEMTIKGYGAKPDWTGATSSDANFNKRYVAALNWANAALDQKDCKRETLHFAKETMGLKTEPFNAIEDWRFANTGKSAFLYNDGCPLDEKSVHYLKEKVQALYDMGLERTKARKKKERAEAKANANLPAPKSAAEKEIDRRNDAWEDLDMLYVEDSVMQKSTQARLAKEPDAAYKILTKYNLKQHSLQWIIDRINDLYGELAKVETDPQVKEAYSHYSKGEIARHKRWLKKMLDDAQNALANSKANQRPRRKKTKSADAQTKHIKYKPYDNDYKLESIDPISIVGAQALLVFNTKSRKVGVYKAKDDNGLQVKGTTLQNWDVHKSGMKTLRKPQDMLPGFRKGTLKRCEVLLHDNINGKLFKMNGRLNPDTVILKAFK